jgi:uncharacterized membrane protein YhaH (DUF805 family)
MSAADPAEIARFFFNVAGRIGRTEYALGTAFILSIDLAVLAFLYAHTHFGAEIVAITALAGVPLTIAMLVLVAKRCHDIGLPGSFVLILVVPGIGLIWLIGLGFIPGNRQPNLYGTPPRFGAD